MRFSDVFPLVPETLLPAGPWKDPQTYVPGADECYGIATGARNGVWVLDLDKKGGKDGVQALCDYVREHGHEDIPDTYAVRTKSGGVHLYFTMPADGLRNRQGILPGVDVRGDGGFVRAGGAYAVLVDTDPVPAPEWLLALVRRKGDPTPKSAGVIALLPGHPEYEHRCNLARKYLAKAPVCVEGQGGDAQLWKVALTLSRTYELPIEESMLLLEEYNARCVPPWDPAALTRKLTEAATKGEGITGTFASDFLAPPPAPEPGPARPVSEWRQRPNPAHVYTFDVAVGVAGQGRSDPLSHRELFASMIGPHATPEWAGVWQHDLFANRLIAVNPPLKLRAEETGFDSTDLVNVKLWFMCAKGYKVKNEVLEETIKSAASAAAFHPLQEYLRECPDVGTQHLKSAGLATQLFGSSEADAPHVVGYLRSWMIGCVARAMCPGAKFDTVLTLLGPGGWRKSEFFKVLAVNSDWYRSNLPDIADPQKVGLAMRGHWIVELGELTAMRRSHRESFLEFITRTEEKFRSPYEKTECIEKRQCGIGATANTVEFMSDLDGAVQRRFLPIEIKKRIDTVWLAEHRDELWSEAYAAYNAGEQWWVDDESSLDSFKAAFTDASPTEELVATFLQSNANRAMIDGKSATDIYGIIFGDAQRRPVPNSHQRKDIGDALKASPGVRQHGTTRDRRYAVSPLPCGDPTPKSAGFFGADGGGP